jgi:hypothetical protein
MSKIELSFINKLTAPNTPRPNPVESSHKKGYTYTSNGDTDTLGHSEFETGDILEDIDGEDNGGSVGKGQGGRLEGLLNHKVSEKECEVGDRHCESMAGLRRKLYELNQEIQRKRYPGGEGVGVRKSVGLR